MFLQYTINMEKKLIIAIDIDDCICNTWEADYNWAYIYAKNNELEIPTKQISMEKYRDVSVFNTFGFTDKQENEVFIKEKKYLMETNGMYPKYFVKEAINKLAKDGHKIIFLTSRDTNHWNNKPEKYAKKWLKKYKIHYDKVVVTSQNKGEFCKQNNCDLLIEDRKNNAFKANSLNIKTILLLNESNQDYENELNFTATCWAEIYDFINKYCIEV